MRVHTHLVLGESLPVLTNGHNYPECEPERGCWQDWPEFFVKCLCRKGAWNPTCPLHPPSRATLQSAYTGAAKPTMQGGNR